MRCATTTPSEMITVNRRPARSSGLSRIPRRRTAKELCSSSGTSKSSSATTASTARSSFAPLVGADDRRRTRAPRPSARRGCRSPTRAPLRGRSRGRPDGSSTGGRRSRRGSCAAPRGAPRGSALRPRRRPTTSRRRGSVPVVRARWPAPARRAGARLRTACSRARRPPCRSRRAARPTNRSTAAILAARSIASSFASESRAMFSPIVVENRKLSWNTIETARRRESGSAWRTSTPPTRTVPVSGSASRTRSWASVDLPPPVSPDDRDGFLRADLAATPRRGRVIRRTWCRTRRHPDPSGPVGKRHRVHRREHGDGLAEDLSRARVPHHRARQLRQDPADEPHRPREEVEQRDEPDQLDRA